MESLYDLDDNTTVGNISVPYRWNTPTFHQRYTSSFLIKLIKSYAFISTAPKSTTHLLVSRRLELITSHLPVLYSIQRLYSHNVKMPAKVSRSVGHETDTEPSSQEPTVPAYSTRNSKRKATELNSSQEPSPSSKSSIKVASINQDAEDSARPAKRTRRSKSSEEKATPPSTTVCLLT